jgi:hypothetical protein
MLLGSSSTAVCHKLGTVVVLEGCGAVDVDVDVLVEGPVDVEVFVKVVVEVDVPVDVEVLLDTEGVEVEVVGDAVLPPPPPQPLASKQPESSANVTAAHLREVTHTPSPVKGPLCKYEAGAKTASTAAPHSRGGPAGQQTE